MPTVVYAPAPADLAEDYARRRRQSGGNPGNDTWPFPPDQSPESYQRISPSNYLDAVSAPVENHNDIPSSDHLRCATRCRSRSASPKPHRPARSA